MKRVIFNERGTAFWSRDQRAYPDRSWQKSFPLPQNGEEWEVEVVAEFGRKVFVRPIRLVSTDAERREREEAERREREEKHAREVEENLRAFYSRPREIVYERGWSTDEIRKRDEDRAAYEAAERERAERLRAAIERVKNEIFPLERLDSAVYHVNRAAKNYAAYWRDDEYGIYFSGHEYLDELDDGFVISSHPGKFVAVLKRDQGGFRIVRPDLFDGLPDWLGV